MKQSTWIECTTNDEKAEFLGLWVDDEIGMPGSATFHTTVIRTKLCDSPVQVIPNHHHVAPFLSGFYRALEISKDGIDLWSQYND